MANGIISLQKPGELILLADGIPTPAGAGISQTLANLLDAYPGKITCICTTGEQVDDYPDRLPAAIVRYSTGPWKTWNNRIGRRFNAYLISRQLRWLSRQKPVLASLPDRRMAWVLVSTNVPHKLLYAWQLLQAGYLVLPYFMDDWLFENRLGWKGNNIQKIAVDMLKSAPCWLMISRQLEATLRKRYGLDKKPCLVVHNPAPDLTGDRLHLPALTAANIKYSVAADQAGMTDNRGKEETQTRFNVESGGRRQLSKVPTTNSTGISDRHLSPVNSHLIIYAGSIWPMHADALIATAKAVHLIQETTSVVGCRSSVVPKLTIYTSESHWKKYQSQLEGPGVTYGGWKPYSEIHSFLQDAWLLLCTASFQDQYKAFSDSSVQTKLTDYMAVGKPILFVGPADAASGVFVEEQDIGFTLGTNQPADIAARLEAISRMPAVWERKASNGRELAASTFSKSVVQQKLYDFLERYALPTHEERVFS